MLKILKFARKYWYVMVAILLLLIVQAFCDLALPEYTSKIVDVGIQSGGIESPVPETLRDETHDTLSMFMTDEELEVYNDAYEKEGDVYQLKDSYQGALLSKDDMTEKKLDALHENKNGADADQVMELRSLMTRKETIITMLLSDGEEADKMKKELLFQMGLQEDADILEAFSMMPRDVVLQITASMEEKLEDMSDMIGESTAIAYVIDEYDQAGRHVDTMQMDYLKKQGGIMVAIAFVGMFMAVIVTYLSSKMAAAVSRNLRKQVFEKVIGFSEAEMNNFSTASLITRCTNDIQQVQNALTMIFRIVVYGPIMGIGGIYKVTQTNSGMEWIIVVAVGAVFTLVGVLMMVAMPKFKMMQSLVDRLNLVSREILTGIPVIRAFGREQHEEERFDTASRNLMKTQLFTNRTMALMMPTMMFVMNAITVLIVWVGAHGVEAGDLKVGTMMAFITYTMQIVISFLMITMVAIIIPRAAVSATRIDEVLHSETIITDPVAPVKLAEDIKGVVSFDHVFFTYPHASESALEDITFVAKPGETTAIIGSTGCGKSTLVQLIPRLFDATQGEVRIDGISVREFAQKDLRSRIGYVPQKGILFSGTIGSNIGFGGKEITQEQIQEAASIAQAEEFIAEKENTYDDPIAQGGNNVSGGQKQRLAIARALASKPKILIFDDSFSALDYKTDKKLREALAEKTKEATVIIVAQRISTILHADKILVLDDGKIVGMGNHEELLAQNEVYRQIAYSQLSEEELNLKSGKGEQ